MSYKYNPLLQQNLQKLQEIPEPPAPVYDFELSASSENAVQNKVVTSAIEDTNNKKVSKFFTSINEIEVGEIAEYQGKTNENFTRGFFYEHRDSVTITELQTTRDYNFSLYLDAYKAGQLYHRQYFISEQQSGLTATQFLVATASSNGKRVSVSLLGVNFFSCNETDTYTNNFGTYYVYPYAEIQDGSNIYVDYDNPVTLVNNKIFYDNTELNFSQFAYSTKIYFGMEPDTHYIYVWVPISSRWIAFLIDSAQAHAAYTPTWSYFEAVNYLTKSSLSPSVSLTVNDYEFTDQTPYAQVDTQQDSIAQYFNLLSSDADAVLVSCNNWTYDNNGKPFPDYSSVTRSIVYLKNEKKFIIAYAFPNSYDLKLYKWFHPDEEIYFYTIGGAPGNVEKEWTLDIIYPSAQSFNENNSMPINSRQLINFRTATTTQNGLMSYVNVSQINSILGRLSIIKYSYGEWISQTVTKQFDYWPITFPTSITGIIIEYTFELRNVQDNEAMFFLAKSSHYYNGYALIVQHYFGTIEGSLNFEYRGVVRYI